MTTKAGDGVSQEPLRGSDRLRLDSAIRFNVGIDLEEGAARQFVRDVPRSLRHADFLSGLTVAGEPLTVSAELPIPASIFGRRSLPFESELGFTPLGATLRPRSLAPNGVGWAEVTGEGRAVADGPGSSRLEYDFAVAVNLVTPSAERWGTQALLKMIELTAASVLRRVVERFPRAIELAAKDAAALPGSAGR